MKNRRVQILVQEFTSSFGLPFEKILPKEVIKETLRVRLLTAWLNG